MKRILLFLAAALATVAVAQAESTLDFSTLQLDNPLATPVAVDPIDKPTPTPAPTPDYMYDTYTSSSMGISFSIPYSWLLNPSTNQETTLQFVEPKAQAVTIATTAPPITTAQRNTACADVLPSSLTIKS